MNKNEHPDLMYDKIVLVANLYYKNNLSQREIANRLNISRPWVSKLLSRAEDLGIVKIKIDSPISGIPDLEEKLKDRYSLSYAVVIDTTYTTKDYKAIAVATPFHSQDQLMQTRGIAWGDGRKRCT